MRQQRHIGTIELVVLFVKVDAVLVLTTGITATTRVLAVLADTTVTGGGLAALLTMLLESCGLSKNKI